VQRGVQLQAAIGEQHSWHDPENGTHKGSTYKAVHKDQIFGAIRGPFTRPEHLRGVGPRTGTWNTTRVRLVRPGYRSDIGSSTGSEPLLTPAAVDTAAGTRPRAATTPRPAAISTDKNWCSGARTLDQDRRAQVRDRVLNAALAAGIPTGCPGGAGEEARAGAVLRCTSLSGQHGSTTGMWASNVGMHASKAARPERCWRMKRKRSQGGRRSDKTAPN